MNHQGNIVDHHVVVRRSLDEIRIAVASRSLNPLARDQHQQNLLHVAVSENNFEIVQYLGTEWDGDRKELVSAVDRYRSTPLRLACYAETPHLKVVEYLLDLFYANEVLDFWSSESPLHIAIERNQVELVKFLVDRAFKSYTNPLSLLESKDGDGRTPLLFACLRTEYKQYHQRLSIVRYLLQLERPNGLNGQLSQPRDKNARTALHLACESYIHLELVTELVEKYNNDVETLDSTNMRPLHVAVQCAVACQQGGNDRLRVVRFLVTQAGADVRAKDGKGWTPLHHACQDKSSRNTELVRLLVENGAETESDDMFGRTALHLACKSDNLRLVEHLVEKEGTTVDLRDNKFSTSLFVACSSGNFAVARYLLTQRADADAENVHKQRPIHIACSNLQYDFLRLIVERYDAKVNVADEYGRTPLHKACMCNIGITNAHAGANVVRFLLENGANVNVSDVEGKTPLLYAVSRGNIDGAKLLISHAANALCPDKCQNNVLHVARSAVIARLLIEGEGESPSELGRGTAYNLLTSTNSKGETPIDVVRRRALIGVYSDDRKLLHYFMSFTDLQVIVVPPQNLDNSKKRARWPPWNAKLSPSQRRYSERMWNLVMRSGLVEDMMCHVFGFLSPLDLMNG